MRNRRARRDQFIAACQRAGAPRSRIANILFGLILLATTPLR
jgi:hypothetical protein